MIDWYTLFWKKGLVIKIGQDNSHVLNLVRIAVPTTSGWGRDHESHVIEFCGVHVLVCLTKKG